MTIRRYFFRWHSPCNAGAVPLFYIGSIPKYDKIKKSIMIVGQEARNYSNLNEVWPQNEIQDFYTGYMARQIFNDNNAYKYNHSPFWKFFRQFDPNQYNLVWDNINKLHKYNDGKTVRLPQEDEYHLNSKYGKRHLSLIEREIELIEPSVVVFCVGPYYLNSIEISFGLASDLHHLELTKLNPCVDISDAFHLKIPFFLTYHPNYLSRIKKIEYCSDIITKSIGKA
jgi:hypothetical protein